MEITISIVNGTLRIYCHKHNLYADNIKAILLWEINTMLLINVGDRCSRTMTSSARRRCHPASQKLGDIKLNCYA